MLRSGAKGSSGTATYPGATASRLIIPFNATAGGLTAWTNMPAAEDFFRGVYQYMIEPVDLTGYTECRIVYVTANVAMVAGAKLIARYRTTIDATITNWLDLGTSEVSVVGGGVNTVYKSSWIPLAAGAKGDVLVTVSGSGGDGVVDPNFGHISVEVR